MKIKYNTKFNTQAIPNIDPICDGGLTEQHHAETMSIPKILAQHRVTGVLPGNGKEPVYEDQPDIFFAEKMEAMAKAKSIYEDLTQEQLGEFKNFDDFIDKTSNPENIIELQKMGLINDPNLENYLYNEALALQDQKDSENEQKQANEPKPASETDAT